MDILYDWLPFEEHNWPAVQCLVWMFHSFQPTISIRRHFVLEKREKERRKKYNTIFFFSDHKKSKKKKAEQRDVTKSVLQSSPLENALGGVMGFLVKERQ